MINKINSPYLKKDIKILYRQNIIGIMQQLNLSINTFTHYAKI